MLRWILLSCLLLGLAQCYSDLKEPSSAFDTKLTRVSVSSTKWQMIMDMSQDLPYHTTYSPKETSQQYKIVVECINRDIVKFWLFDMMHAVFRME